MTRHKKHAATTHITDAPDLVCFFSGSLGGKYLERIVDICDARLLSCHKSYINVARAWLTEAARHPQAKQREIMLDSGAFSAWSKGEEAHLSDVMSIYEELTQEYGASFKDIWMINLDKIPGEQKKMKDGIFPSQAERAEALDISDRNLEKLMERFGDHVLPVFHRTEDPARLETIIEQNPRYICISPLVDAQEGVRREWGQRVHQITGTVWTHGLAATGEKMMMQVPWRSVDSAAWTQLAGYGKLTLCVGEGSGLRLFVGRRISEDADARRELNGHLDNITELEKPVLYAAIEETGMTVAEARTDYSCRAYINMYHYAKFIKQMKRHLPPVQQTLFEL
jgi:hypothetical protein